MRRVAILYHFMYPDDVVSAHHLDGLAQDLAVAGWQVEALPSNRGCRDEQRKYAKTDEYRGVKYRRVWRPRFSQKSFVGRLLNSVWMISAWAMIAFRRKQDRPNVLVIGTDPMFGLIAAIIIKRIAKDIQIAHWCFDMHPEAALEQSVVSPNGLLAKLSKRLMKSGYRSCDLIVDIGPCMRRRLRMYNHGRPEAELTPWALKEPNAPFGSDRSIREELFGSAKLGLLYSGNFGEAHSYESLLKLVRELRHETDIHFCFAVRGNKVESLRSEITDEDTNVSFAGFAKLEDLDKRLGSADIHIATLKENWAGIAVPSKFFGSLSAGRPVLYSGPEESAIGTWIKQFGIGLVLNANNTALIAREICDLRDSPDRILEMRTRAHRVYAQNFSRSAVTKGWCRNIERLTPESRFGS